MAFEDLECVKIESEHEDLKWRTEAYLRASGWQHTSSTVGCYWMWFKEIKGRSYGCCTDDAFRIQNTLDREAYAGAHPDEFED